MNSTEELKKVEKKIIMYNLLGTPGAIMVGFSLYALFSNDDMSFFPLFQDKDIVRMTFLIGIVIMLWELYKIIPLLKQKSAMYKKQNTSK